MKGVDKLASPKNKHPYPLENYVPPKHLIRTDEEARSQRAFVRLIYHVNAITESHQFLETFQDHLGNDDEDLSSIGSSDTDD